MKIRWGSGDGGGGSGCVCAGSCTFMYERIIMCLFNRTRTLALSPLCTSSHSLSLPCSHAHISIIMKVNEWIVQRIIFFLLFSFKCHFYFCHEIWKPASVCVWACERIPWITVTKATKTFVKWQTWFCCRHRRCRWHLRCRCCCCAFVFPP